MVGGVSALPDERQTVTTELHTQLHTELPTTPDPDLDGYTPDAYAATVTHRTGGANTTEHRLVVTLAVMNAACRIMGAPISYTVAAPALDADGEPLDLIPPTVRAEAAALVWPEGLTPDAYVASLARRLAGPVGPAYTPAQWDRITIFAARHVYGQLSRDLNALLRETPSRLPLQVRDAADRRVRLMLTEQFLHLTEANRRLVMIQAYMFAHPDGEAKADEMHVLTSFIRDWDGSVFF